LEKNKHNVNCYFRFCCCFLMPNWQKGRNFVLFCFVFWRLLTLLPWSITMCLDPLSLLNL